MTSPEAERFARLDALFQEALERPEAERRAWLREACDDPELRSEVEGLLAEDARGDDLEHIVDRQWVDAADQASQRTDDSPGDFLGDDPHGEDPGDPGTTRVVEAPQPLPGEEDPEQVGPYRILGRLGRGGIATVYLAERQGEFSMPVALKRIRRGMDTDDIVLRLRLERQILARLIHPNICRIHDGGSDEDGRPYLVMEVIEGRRIDDWCCEEKLSLRRRLEAFEAVCEAVEYAHRNLVLHRDLKPSNILVTTEGVPKLLDFGIAKLLRGEGGVAEDAPTLTRLGHQMLTPEYASPEQLLGMPLSTATDIYSLGAVLFELASGRLPHQPKDGSARHALGWAMARSEREARAVSETARWARSADEPLAPALDRFTARHGEELDAIVAKALEPEPSRRYGSARELAEDVRRLLDGLPVLARRQTLTYRTWKLIRRHRTGVATAALVAISLVSATIVTSRQATVAQEARVQAEAERLRAEEEKRQAEAVGGFLVDLFAVSNPFSETSLVTNPADGSRPRGEAVTARELLDAGARRIATGLREDPLARAEIQRAMAQAYLGLSLYPEARRLLEAAGEDLRNAGASAPGAEVEAAIGWAALLRDLGILEIREARFDEAGEHLADARRRFQELGEAGRVEIPLTLERLGELSRLRGDLDAAEKLYTRAVELQSSLARARAMAGLAGTVQDKGDFERATALLKEVLAERIDALGPKHPLVLETTSDLAISSSAHDPAAATEIFEQLLEDQREVLGPEHHELVTTLYNLATTLARRQEPKAAEAHLREAWDIASRTIPSSPIAGKILMLQGLIRERAGDSETAVGFYERALELREELYPLGHPETLNAMLRLGILHWRLEDPRAEPSLRSIVLAGAGAGAGHAVEQRALAHIFLADLATRRERWEEVQEAALQGLDLFADDDENHGFSDLAAVLEMHSARAVWRLGRPEEAAVLIERSAATLHKLRGPNHSWTREAQDLRAKILP